MKKRNKERKTVPDEVNRELDRLNRAGAAEVLKQEKKRKVDLCYARPKTKFKTTHKDIFQLCIDGSVAMECLATPEEMEIFVETLTFCAKHFKFTYEYNGI